MRATSERTIFVFADWDGLPGPRLMGRLHATPGRGKEVFRFEYDRKWLASRERQEVDPELLLFDGPQYPAEKRANFGAFLDSCPDRWGRVLMRRREERESRKAGRPAIKLLESDYLLGVHDQHRIGALRFKLEEHGPFLDDRTELAAPPMARLRELENASLQLEKDGAEDDKDYDQWLRMLIAPGGSLGGARPKASVIDTDGSLWIAKFPSRNDDTDLGGWEKVVHDLAQRAGISTPEAMAKRFNTSRHVFLSRRFDRTNGQRRIHFASAMTLLGRSDGDDHSAGVSYLELAEFIIRNGARTDADLEQLWRRIVFFISVSNTDDHLRNHGFLQVPGGGWTLAPAYDMNPSPGADGLLLNITEGDNALSLDLAREVADLFRVKERRAGEIITEVVAAVQPWRKLAERIGISGRESERVASAFRLADGGIGQRP